MIDDQKILKYKLSEGDEYRLIEVLGSTDDPNPVPKRGYIYPANDTVYMCVSPEDLEFVNTFRVPIFYKD